MYTNRDVKVQDRCCMAPEVTSENVDWYSHTGELRLESVEHTVAERFRTSGGIDLEIQQPFQEE